MHDVRSEPGEDGWVAWCNDCKIVRTRLTRTEALEIRRTHLNGAPIRGGTRLTTGEP